MYYCALPTKTSKNKLVLLLTALFFIAPEVNNGNCEQTTLCSLLCQNDAKAVILEYFASVNPIKCLNFSIATQIHCCC